ncbi:J domain-containing protein [Limnohabitans sp. Rim8]|uniref:J domain-containing protein n=1 Tax=Limnohabitans sp. Rim8 TaxID=1100718 RepID=UPI002620992A|nr:J domain-containing protein [Limnohabitans sp. Rim8]
MTPSPEALQDAALSLSALMVQPGEQARLSPAQQRFNDLLARIEKLSGLIQRLEAWSDQHRYAHIQALRVSVQQAQVHRKSLLLFVHDRLQTADLTDRQHRMARGLLRGLIDQLSATADPQVKALAEVYVSEEDTQEAADEQAQAAQALRERIEEALGQPLHKPSQYQTPEEMMQAGMRQWQQQQEANEARKAAKRAARKAQKQAQKQSAAAEKGDVPPAMLRELDAKSAIRTIFRQLASALHPDREPDEQERLRKTALMSEVNAAYEKNDLTTLLRLQMQGTQGNHQSGSHLADDKLIAMCMLLKEQLAALEEDLDQLQTRLSLELCVPVQAEADVALMTQSLQRLQADQRHISDSLEADLRRIQNEAELKRWLKEQWQLAKATSA